MKVLFLCSRFPYPPYRGDRVSTYYTLRSLGKKHDVTLLSFTDGSESDDAMDEMRRHCRTIETVHMPPRKSWLKALVALPSTTPSQVSFYESSEMRRKVDRLLAHDTYDAIVVHMIRMAPYAARVDHPAKVLFMGDSLGLALKRSLAYRPWWMRSVVEWEHWRIERFERHALQHFTEGWVLSDVDRDDLVARGCTNVVTHPQGVDDRLFELPLRERAGARLFFLGNLSVAHNVDAALYMTRDIFPAVRSAVPEATLELAGADPRPEVQALAKLPGVSVPGPIPDLLDRWRNVSVLVAPLRFSTGIQNKVIEAMAAGVPVVTTPAVAAGIHAQSLAIVHIGDSTEALANLTVRVLRAPAESAEMVRNARDFVRKRFRWDLLRERLEELVGP